MSKSHTYAEATPEQLDYIHRHAQVGDVAIVRRFHATTCSLTVQPLRVVEVGLQNESGYPFNIRLEDGTIIGMFAHYDGVAKHMVCPGDQLRTEFAILRKFIEAVRKERADNNPPDLRIAVARVFMCAGKYETRYTVVDAKSCDHLRALHKEETSADVGFVPGSEDGWEEDEADQDDMQTSYMIGDYNITAALWATSPTGGMSYIQ